MESIFGKRRDSCFFAGKIKNAGISYLQRPNDTKSNGVLTRRQVRKDRFNWCEVIIADERGNGKRSFPLPQQFLLALSQFAGAVGGQQFFQITDLLL